MKNRTSMVSFLCAGLLALCGAGCTSMIPRNYPAEQPGETHDRQLLASRLSDTLASSFPTGVRVLHRVVMTIAGRQFALDGHLTIQPDGTMELLVLGPMGVLADLVTTPEGTVDVRRHNRRFRERWVEKFIARDLLLLCSAPPEGETLRASVLEDEIPFLERHLPERHHICRYFFDPKGENWTGITIYRRGHRLYDAECLQTRMFPGQRQEFPALLTVTAKRYQLNIRVVQLSALPLPAIDEAQPTVDP